MFNYIGDLHIQKLYYLSVLNLSTKVNLHEYKALEISPNKIPASAASAGDLEGHKLDQVLMYPNDPQQRTIYNIPAVNMMSSPMLQIKNITGEV